MRTDALLRQKRKLDPTGKDLSPSLTVSPAGRRSARHSQKAAVEDQIADCFRLAKEIRAAEVMRLAKTFLRNDLRKSVGNIDLRRCLCAILGITHKSDNRTNRGNAGRQGVPKNNRQTRRHDSPLG